MNNIIKSILIISIVFYLSSAITISASAVTELSNSDGGTWKYQRDIYIKENSGTVLNDYQVLVDMEGGDFPSEAKINGEDIRFTDINGNELNYWIESWDQSNKDAKVWVNIPEIPAKGETRIKIYYGNQNARSSSNGDTTFEFFDDFSGTSLDTNKWKVEWGKNFRITDGRLKVGSNTGIRTTIAFPQPKIFEAKVWTTAFFWAKSGESNNMQVGFDNFNALKSSIHRSKTSYRDLMSFSKIDIDNTELIHTIKWKADRAIFQHSYSTVAAHSEGIPPGPLYLSFQADQTSQDMLVDWARVRKYASPEPTVISKLFISKSASPYKIMQGKNSTISIFIKNYADTDIKDIYISDSISKGFDLISSDFPNRKKIDTLRIGESRQIQYSISAKERGNFTLDPVKFSFTDHDGSIQERESEPVSIIVLAPEKIPEQASDQLLENASVSLQGEKTDVALGEDILLRLSAVNLITKPLMHVQVILIPPSGMSVTSSEFSMVAAGQFAANYELQPGDGADIEVKMRSNQAGDFNVNGRVIYYFEGEKDKSEDQIQNLLINVREKPDSTAPPYGDGTKPETPGFEGGIAIIGLLLVALFVRSSVYK